MSELPKSDPTRAARLAVDDYLSVGPAANFGELEVGALNEWIGVCGDTPLNGQGMTSVAWMHVERAWSNVAEAGLLAKEVPPDLKRAVRQDLTGALSFFTRAESISSAALAAHIKVAKLSIPTLDQSLVGHGTTLCSGGMARYLDAQSAALEERLRLYKQSGTAHDVPGIYSASGIVLLTSQFLQTDYVPLPSSIRHWSGGGSHYDYWHAVIYDRDNGHRHKVRFAPYGSPDMLLIPPAAMLNADFPSAHGLGTAEALVHIHQVRRSVDSDKPITPNPTAGAHVDKVDDKIEACITDQFPILQGRGQREVITVTQPRAWYDGLSPHHDPGHPMFGSALERAISELEVRAIQDELPPDDMHTLGWMHIESAMSMTAQRQSNRDALLGSFERAEDLFCEATSTAPEGSSRFYEYALAAIAAPMYLVIRQQEHTATAIDTYVERLTLLADDMLSTYTKLKDKSGVEGQALWRQLQLATIYISLTGQPSKTRIITPVSPRERGGSSRPQGWDFAVWEWVGIERYELGSFYGRLDDREERRTLEEGVMTIGVRTLGQWTPQHGFVTLRSVLTEQNPSLPNAANKIDHKLLSKIRRSLSRLTNEAQ